jgi:hypothetical protein
LCPPACLRAQSHAKNGGAPGGFSAGRPLHYQPACKPGSVWPAARAANVTAIPLVRRLPGASCNLPERQIRTDPGLLPRRSYSVLLPVGFAVPPPLPEARCALTAPFHPYRGQYATQPRRSVLCGTVPEARSACAGQPPPDVIRHRLSLEPGLSSPAAFRHWRGAAVRPTDADRDGARRLRRQGGPGRRAKSQKRPGPIGRGDRPGREGSRW